MHKVLCAGFNFWNALKPCKWSDSLHNTFSHKGLGDAKLIVVDNLQKQATLFPSLHPLHYSRMSPSPQGEMPAARQVPWGMRGEVYAYLPRSQGHQPRLLAKRALLNLMHKLGQLGMRSAAVVNLRKTKQPRKKRTKSGPETLQCSSLSWCPISRGFALFPFLHQYPSSSLSSASLLLWSPSPSFINAQHGKQTTQKYTVPVTRDK